jgi:hypothetical protein
MFAQNKTGTFTEIEIDGPVIIQLVAGTTNEVSVTKEADLVQWEINGDALVIMAQQRKYHDTPEVRITVAQLEALETTGSVIIKSEGVFANRKLELTITSQSIIDLEVDVETLIVRAKDQSVVNLSGAADDLQLKLNSQSIINAKSLKSGLIDVRARQQSVANINTSGAKVTKEVSDQSAVVE